MVNPTLFRSAKPTHLGEDLVKTALVDVELEWVGVAKGPARDPPWLWRRSAAPAGMEIDGDRPIGFRAGWACGQPRLERRLCRRGGGRPHRRKSGQPAGSRSNEPSGPRATLSNSYCLRIDERGRCAHRPTLLDGEPNVLQLKPLPRFPEEDTAARASTTR